MMQQLKHSRGFTLTELSITIAVLGLLVASVSTGVHLLDLARLNKVISEITGYKEAVDNFHLKYRYFPGDMPNATNFWGTYNQTTNPTGTVNGNGNEQVAEGVNAEELWSWQQLARSNMVDNSFTGVDAGTPDYQGGINVPNGALVTSYYRIYFVTNYFGQDGNAIFFTSNDINDDPTGPAITPEDAFIIDRKIDDSDPSTGEIFALRSEANIATSGSCTDNNHLQASAVYLPTEDAVSCRMMLWINKI